VWPPSLLGRRVQWRLLCASIDLPLLYVLRNTCLVKSQDCTIYVIVIFAEYYTLGRVKVVCHRVTQYAVRRLLHAVVVSNHRAGNRSYQGRCRPHAVFALAFTGKTTSTRQISQENEIFFLVNSKGMPERAEDLQSPDRRRKSDFLFSRWTWTKERCGGNALK